MRNLSQTGLDMEKKCPKVFNLNSWEDLKEHLNDSVLL